MEAIHSQIVEVVHTLCQATDGSKELDVHLLVPWQPDHLVRCDYSKF